MSMLIGTVVTTLGMAIFFGSLKPTLPVLFVGLGPDAGSSRSSFASVAANAIANDRAEPRVPA